MATTRYAPGVPLNPPPATVASQTDYDGTPEGVLNTRQNLATVAAGVTTSLGRPVDPGMPQNFP
jgi:hypothetical protein